MQTVSGTLQGREVEYRAVAERSARSIQIRVAVLEANVEIAILRLGCWYCCPHYEAMTSGSDDELERRALRDIITGSLPLSVAAAIESSRAIGHAAGGLRPGMVGLPWHDGEGERLKAEFELALAEQRQHDSEGPPN